MSRERFIAKDFRGSSKEIIDQANKIIAEYAAQGFTLTLRQLYYQFVARDLLANKQQNYKRLGSILSDARLAGLIDWDAIEDRTRFLREQPKWGSPEDILAAVAQQYREDLWRTQPRYVEVWIEKDALIGVIEPICNELRLPYFACRGYASQSEQYGAGKRLRRMADRRGQHPLILHLGDHDPSGLDMTRDNGDRLSMFARQGIDVKRLALNMDQIELYDPPPNPAKETDSRHADYVERYQTDESWELDALEPTVISALIREAVDEVRDEAAWTAAETEEQVNRELLEQVSGSLDDVRRYLKYRNVEVLSTLDFVVAEDVLRDAENQDDAED